MEFGAERGDVGFADILRVVVSFATSFTEQGHAYQELLYKPIDPPLHLRVLALRNSRGRRKQIERIVPLHLGPENRPVHHTAPERHCLAQRIRHTLPPSRRVNNHAPPMLAHHIQQLQVEPAQTKRPFAHMAVRALEVDAGSLQVQRDVPAPAALVGDKGRVIRGGDAGDEVAVFADGVEAIGDG